MSMKNSNDTIRNRTNDLPACSAEPQPTALPRASMVIINNDNYVVIIHNMMLTYSLIKFIDVLLYTVYGKMHTNI
jgi:hypothetical protein